MTFSGAADMNHKPFWSYAGNWSLNGNQLIWTYTQSSIALPETARVDTDEILSVDDHTLVLISKLSGKQRVFTRENNTKITNLNHIIR